VRDAWIISVGTELTLGQTIGTNAAWLADRLAAIGIRATRHVTVSDDLEPIREVLLQAAGQTQLILVTGGLGATRDDVTRAAVSDAAGDPLVMHPPSVERMRAYFSRRNRAIPESNQVQAQIPRTARAIENTCGTATGFAVRLRGTQCYALPGVPEEMQAMFERDVATELRAAAAGRVIRSRRLNCIGLPESELGARIGDLMARGRNPEVGTTADHGIIGVRINAVGDAESEAVERLDQAEAEVRLRLGDAVFSTGDVTLAQVVGGLLRNRKAMVSTAESCTGGLVGEWLTDVAGSSDYYLGGVVAYSNDAKSRCLGVPSKLIRKHGAVSDAVARSMARGAQDAFGSEYALAVTGIAGPGGGTAEKPVGLVYLGLATPTDVRMSEHFLGADASRAAIRTRSARLALDLLRRELLRADR
jgi:nicotinamide-nucleotide amidase